MVASGSASADLISGWFLYHVCDSTCVCVRERDLHEENLYCSPAWDYGKGFWVSAAVCLTRCGKGHAIIHGCIRLPYQQINSTWFQCHACDSTCVPYPSSKVHAIIMIASGSHITPIPADDQVVGVCIMTVTAPVCLTLLTKCMPSPWLHLAPMPAG